MPSSRGSSPTRDGNAVSHISYLLHWFFTTSATWEAQNAQHLLPKKKKKQLLNLNHLIQIQNHTESNILI